MAFIEEVAECFLKLGDTKPELHSKGKEILPREGGRVGGPNGRAGEPIAK